MNANAGLRGVRPNSRQVMNVTGTVAGIPLIQHREFLQLEDAPWAKRAWTFQEALFSQRWLIFARDSVYYSCPNGTFSEHKPEDNAAEPSTYKTEHALKSSFIRSPTACGLWSRLRSKSSPVHRARSFVRGGHPSSFCWYH